MAVEPATLQLRREKALRTTLSDDSGVKKALEKLKELMSGWGFGSRRDLLTGALRLTRTMAPEVAESVAACRDAIGFKRPIEVYVKPDPHINACCMKNPTGPVLIVLSSRLIEVFTPAELRFVIGHELGHAAYDHFSIPMPHTAKVEDLGGTIVSRKTSLDLYVWCRAAELSADRIGMVCAQDPEAAASGFFKIASGLSSPRVKTDLAEYSKQVESLASTPLARAKPRDDDDTLDCFSTHPYSPVRVRAVVAFSKSAAYQSAIGRGSGGLSEDDVDAVIERDLSLMEPTYLEDVKTPKADALKRLLYSAGVSVAASSGEVEESELTALAALLGAEYTSGKLDPTVARKDLEGRVADVLKVATYPDRCQLVQHLTIVAAADGVVEETEVAEMHRIAALLGVDGLVVEQTLRGAAAPMD